MLISTIISFCRSTPIASKKLSVSLAMKIRTARKIIARSAEHLSMPMNEGTSRYSRQPLHSPHRTFVTRLDTYACSIPSSSIVGAFSTVTGR